LLEVRLREGLPGLGSTESDDVEKSRRDADGAFTSVQLTAARRQHITDKVSLYLGGKAQFSFDPLLADEECSVGGEIYGRGYDPAEIADDDCLAGTVELQFTPEWRPDFLKEIVPSYQLYGFYDVGRVWPEDGDFGDGNALQSAGIGLRTQFWDWLRVDLEVAKPLTRERSFDTHDKRMPQFYLGATTQF
jgi:hemolysin activation/secretion protein